MNKNDNKDLDKPEESNFLEENFHSQGKKEIIDNVSLKTKKNKKTKLNKKVDSSTEEKQKKEEEISNLREEKLRLLAEMENLRKRASREKIDSIKFGSSNLARDILSASDNLSRALESLPEEKDRTQSISNFIDGLTMIHKELISILEKHGVKKINAMQKKFDHNYHQAILEVETKEHEEGVVVQEIQSGYTMHDRLLRPAMVGVSKKSAKDKKS